MNPFHFRLYIRSSQVSDRFLILNSLLFVFSFINIILHWLSVRVRAVGYAGYAYTARVFNRKLQDSQSYPNEEAQFPAVDTSSSSPLTR